MTDSILLRLSKNLGLRQSSRRKRSLRDRRMSMVEVLEPRLAFDAGWASAMQGVSVSDMVGDTAGNTYTTGTLSAQSVIGNVNYSNSNGELFIAKSDPSGLVLWVKQFGGRAEPHSRDIDLDASGNVIVVGDFQGTGLFGSQMLLSAGASDAFVAKLGGEDGQFQWARSIGGGLNDFALAAATDVHGDVVISGGLDSNSDPSSLGAPVLFVSKVNGSSGNELWSSHVNVAGPYSSYFQELAVDATGAIYASGRLSGRAEFTTGTVTSSATLPASGGTGNALVSKMSSNGNWLWANALPGDTSSYVKSSAISAEGQLYVSGTFRGSVQYGLSPMTSAGEGDGFVAQIDGQSGIANWGSRLGGKSFDIAAEVAIDPAGMLLVVGSFIGTADFGPDVLSTAPAATAEVANGFISTLDSLGGFVQSHRFVTTSKGAALTISGLNVDSQGAVSICGIIPNRGTVAQFPQQELTFDSGANLVASSFTVKLPAATATKFFVANDSSRDRTYQYDASGELTVDHFTFNAANSAPRGAASTAAGDKLWVVDANKNVYVYSASGSLLGSWVAGGLASTSQVEGITTNGTDIWLVDAQQDKVFKYAGAAGRLSGSQTASSSFKLNSANSNAKDLVTDGASLWVINDASTDKVFKYSMTGALVGSWTITTPGATSPTGITLNPAAPSELWIVDNGSDKIYQYNAAVGRTSGSQAAAATFALAVGNTNPQGIADPPSPPRASPAETRTFTSQATADDSLQTVSPDVLSGARPTVLGTRLHEARPGLQQDDRQVYSGMQRSTPDDQPIDHLEADNVSKWFQTYTRHYDEALTSIVDDLEGQLPIKSLRASLSDKV